MTIGNLDKSIRRKPSYGAQILVGYLPTTTLDGVDLTDVAARTLRARIFHRSLSIIFESMKAAAKDGIELTSGDGAIRRCYPILACYVADYPEQCLVSCVRSGQTCPKCNIKHNQLGDNAKGELRLQTETIHLIRGANAAGAAKTQKDMDNRLKNCGLNNIPDPFFADWPHTNIHSAITSDILHQLYQGLIKHLLNWVTYLMGEDELDARIKRLPRSHGLRLFVDGISGLTMMSGNEHKAISHQLLGCLVNSPKVPAGAIRAARALLDFLFIAQYENHTTDSLKFLQDALDEFHKYKEVFVNLGARLGE